MDPKEALRVVNATGEGGECRAYRAECLEALADWLRKGGFMPTGEPGDEMHPTLTEAACESLRSEGLFELACSVRAALAHGDASGI